MVSWRACRRISTRVAAETIKKAIEEGHCANERAVKAAAEGDVSLQVRRFLPLSSPCCSSSHFVNELVRMDDGSLKFRPISYLCTFTSIPWHVQCICRKSDS